MASLYSTRILGPVDLGPGSPLSTRVPIGFIWVLREINAVPQFGFPAVAANTAFPAGDLSVQITTGGVSYPTIQSPPSIGPSGFSWQGRIVLNADDYIGVLTGIWGWTVSMSGYQLSAP